MDMKRRFIHRLATTLESNGIKISKENSSSLIVLRLMLSIVLTGSCQVSLIMFLIQNYDNVIKLLNPLIAFSGVTLLSAGILVLFYHRRMISQMLYQMDGHVYVYNDELDVQYKWYLREESFETFMSVAWYFHFFVPIFLSLQSVTELIFFGEVTHYVYPCWTPWNRKDMKTQILTLVLQLGHVVISCRFNYAILLLIFLVLFEYLRQYERLKIAISTLNQRSRCDEGKKEIIEIHDNVMDERIRKNVIECIQHHQLLHQNFALFKAWFQVFFSLELVSTMFSFSLGFYIVFKALTEEVALYLTAVFILSTNVLCRCFIGEIFSELNDGMKSLVFFETQCWEMNAENRRLFIIFHFLLDQPFLLYGFSIFGATLCMFANIIRKAYSVFNVLNVSLK